MATHSSMLAWRIPWTEDPGGLQSMGSHRVAHDWATEHACMLLSRLLRRPDCECGLEVLVLEQESWPFMSMVKLLHIPPFSSSFCKMGTSHHSLLTGSFVRINWENACKSWPWGLAHNFSICGLSILCLWQIGASQPRQAACLAQTSQSLWR